MLVRVHTSTQRNLRRALLGAAIMLIRHRPLQKCEIATGIEGKIQQFSYFEFFSLYLNMLARRTTIHQRIVAKPHTCKGQSATWWLMISCFVLTYVQRKKITQNIKEDPNGAELSIQIAGEHDFGTIVANECASVILLALQAEFAQESVQFPQLLQYTRK